jgi:hypothetical protein
MKIGWNTESNSNYLPVLSRSCSKRDQFVANLAASQTADIENRVAALHGTQTNFFERPGSGLQPRQNVKAGRTGNARIDVFWDTAYAGKEPLVSYEILRREENDRTPALCRHRPPRSLSVSPIRG